MARRLYFAYGSNMSVAQMRHRCPASKPVGKGVLKGWRFIINARGTASIVKSDAHDVHGVLFSVTATCLNTLDLYEGVAKGRYLRRNLRVDLPMAGSVPPPTAVVYAGLERQPKVLTSIPIRAYLGGVVLPAAKAWALPEPYVDYLEAHMPTTPVGPLKKTRRSPRSLWRS